MIALAARQQALKRAIVDGAPAGGVRGHLAIYQAAYAARLVAALRDNFGVLPQVMGDEGFDALAAAYLAAHPSRHASIRWFGEHLPAFMAARSELVPHPAMLDLAHMEWALRSAFDAADALPIDAAALADLAPAEWPRLAFAPLPSLQWLALAWEVEPVWRALQDGEPAADAPALPEPVERAHTLLVWRPALETRWRALEAAPARWLQAALAGQPFAALCALAAEDLGEAPAAAAVAGALRGWIGDGLFAAWRLLPAEGAAPSLPNRRAPA